MEAVIIGMLCHCSVPCIIRVNQLDVIVVSSISETNGFWDITTALSVFELCGWLVANASDITGLRFMKTLDTAIGGIQYRERGE
jgi:hypothetical protein